MSDRSDGLDDGSSDKEPDDYENSSSKGERDELGLEKMPFSDIQDSYVEDPEKLANNVAEDIREKDPTVLQVQEEVKIKKKGRNVLRETPEVRVQKGRSLVIVEDYQPEIEKIDKQVSYGVLNRLDEEYGDRGSEVGGVLCIKDPEAENSVVYSIDRSGVNKSTENHIRKSNENYITF